MLFCLFQDIFPNFSRHFAAHSGKSRSEMVSFCIRMNHNVWASGFPNGLDHRIFNPSCTVAIHFGSSAPLWPHNGG